MPSKRNVDRRRKPTLRDRAKEDDIQEQEKRPTDPARLMMMAMLHRKLVDFPAAEVAKCVCMVQLPSAVWLEGMPGVWGEIVHDHGDGRDGDDGLWYEAYWVYFSRASTSVFTKSGDAEVVRALWEKLPLVGISDDLMALPYELIQASDVLLSLTPPQPDDVSSVAEALTGEKPANVLTLDEAARLNPRLLRLAVRPEQTADAWVDKLRELLGREGEVPVTAPPPPPKAPRAAPDLTRLHGMPEAVEWGLALARDIEAYRKGDLPWSAVDGGCLLSGPPGVGKTLFARALAQTCGVPLIHGSYSIWHSSGAAHQGEFLKAMRKAFATAKKQAPSILFVDEIDSFPDRGKLTHRWADYEIQIVNAFLAEIDGADDREGVVLMGACNHPEKLDPALVRSGRLDRQIRLGLPDVAALAAILREHLGDDLPGVDLTGIATFAVGASGADCERMVRGARRRARVADRPMETSDLHAEVVGKTDSLADVRLAAVHESGHVVAVMALGFGEVHAVSLRSSAGQGGAAMLHTYDKAYALPRDIHIRLMSLLAGRAAEEVILGEASSGAGGGSRSDLARATNLAMHASLSLGLDPASGLLWSGQFDDNRVSEVLAADHELAGRIKERLAEAYADAVALIRVHKAAVVALAEALVVRGALNTLEISRIVVAALPENPGTFQPTNSQDAP